MVQADPGDVVHGADTTESLRGLDASRIGLSVSALTVRPGAETRD
jgi:hypothetical protein